MKTCSKCGKEATYTHRLKPGGRHPDAGKGIGWTTFCDPCFKELKPYLLANPLYDYWTRNDQ